MAFKPGQSGNPLGKPKGATSKPRLSDYMSKEDIDAVVKKALEMAKDGNETMMKLIIEQNFGKPSQAITGPEGGPIQISGVEISVRK